LNILFIGDVVGRIGRNAIAHNLASLIGQYDIAFTIINAENAAGGFGLTPDTAAQLLDAGADCLTSGNHIWAQKEAEQLLDNEQRVLRPANYPPGAPGQGSAIYQTSEGIKVSVINLLGRVFMEPVDCPFRCVESEIEQISESSDLIVVDFHGEATSEKQAMGYFLDGRVTAVIGTHTHVQTADEKLLAGGTAYITDCGMTGPDDTVIGIDKHIIIEKFVSGRPQRFEVPKSGPCLISGVVVKCSIHTGLAETIERIHITY